MIVCHIRTSSGPRWSYHDTNEQLRQELIEYWNEVHAGNGQDDDALPEDATLEKAIETIEQYEEVSVDN